MQNNKRADRTMESSDSSEIPDRGEISEVPGLPLVLVWEVLEKVK